MSASPKEFISQFRAENPGERLTYQAILSATGLKDLENADLRGADLGSADLGNANLQDANLWNATLQDADL